MIYGDLNCKGTWDYLTRIDDLRTCFTWLTGISRNIENGNYDVGGGLSAYVHSYNTIKAEDAKFESHITAVDLQYCISGGERIDWAPISALENPSQYCEEKDVILYKGVSEQISSIKMIPGRFAIFGQSDGHRPKISDSINQSVHKLVIKLSSNTLYL